MRVTDLPTARDCLERAKIADPEFAATWDRSAIARAFSVVAIDFRARNGLTQTQLADGLGVSLDVIERLEEGAGPDEDL